MDHIDGWDRQIISGLAGCWTESVPCKTKTRRLTASFRALSLLHVKFPKWTLD